jgi:hypothetical protein
LVGDLIANNVKFDVKPREEGSLLMTLLVSWGPMLLLIGGITVIRAFFEAGFWALTSIAILLWIVIHSVVPPVEQGVGFRLVYRIPVVAAGIFQDQPPRHVVDLTIPFE